MLVICFQNKKGELYSRALRKALNFDGYEQINNNNYVHTTFDEIIHHWSWFDTMFEIVSQWKETKIFFQDKEYSSKEDLYCFYEIAKSLYYEWLEFTNSHIVSIYKDVPAKHRIMSEDPGNLTDDELDQLIDLMLNDNNARLEYSTVRSFKS